MKIEEVFEYNQHFVSMLNIINYSRKFPPENGHKHHIIPKCWFKHNNLEIDNSDENLVLLSYENHAKVHKLAYLCSKTPYMRSAMALAAHRLDKDVIGCPYNFTAEHRQKISEANKGRKMSDEAKKKMSETCKGRPGYWKGKHLTEEAKRKISKNNASRTKEARERVSKQFKGKHLTDEHKAKISEAGKGHIVSEDTRKKLSKVHKGRVFSKEWKKKLSDSHKGKHWKMVDGRRVWYD